MLLRQSLEGATGFIRLLRVFPRQTLRQRTGNKGAYSNVVAYRLVEPSDASLNTSLGNLAARAQKVCQQGGRLVTVFRSHSIAFKIVYVLQLGMLATRDFIIIFAADRHDDGNDDGDDV